MGSQLGDFQTSITLARSIVHLVNSVCGAPARVVEPTAGQGAFLEAAEELWGDRCRYRGYELNSAYVRHANERLSTRGIHVQQQDFFQADWNALLSSAGNESVLVLGNPPWVTNAELGRVGSTNLPAKSNFQQLRGLEAKTGKANFDIAEWMLIRLLEALPANGALAMLCKTMTARKVLRHAWQNGLGRTHTALYLIDAKSSFQVSVEACLLFLSGSPCAAGTAAVYPDLDSQRPESEFGLLDGQLVSDPASYRELHDLQTGEPCDWRSGLKHDAADVMELTEAAGRYRNRQGQPVNIEPEYVFPLLKSSDIGNGRARPRRFVIVTQHRTGEDTGRIEHVAPRAWAYLQAHAERLDRRRSSVYRHRPRFSIFGIGPYSFAPFKVAVSGLYDTCRFVAVSPQAGRPVMLDDTCYGVACRSAEEAGLIAELLNAEVAQRFLRSLMFPGTKRPVTIDVLRRIVPAQVARRLGRRDEWERVAR